MAQTALRRWTLDEFFTWQERQEDRYELVDGLPVWMPAGAANRHDDILVNPLSHLSTRLRGTPYRPFTGNGAVETYPGHIRRPDAGVDGGRSDPDGFLAADVRLVAEVLSPTTRDLETALKVPEYKSIAGLDVILLIETNAPLACVWSRNADRAWVETRIEGVSGAVDLAGLGITLPLAELYDGIDFRPKLSASDTLT